MSDRAYYEKKLKELKRNRNNIDAQIIKVQGYLDNDDFPQKNGKKPQKTTKEPEKTLKKDESSWMG